MRFRVGQGFDTHALVPGRKLVLAGVELGGALGLLGHSDADVLAHAAIDALLGASALGDIGDMFPDTDERYRGADSMQLLALALQRVRGEGWQLVNVDCTIIAQRPKIAPFVEAMRGSLARALALEPSAVSIKAKTTEARIYRAWRRYRRFGGSGSDGNVGTAIYRRHAPCRGPVYRPQRARRAQKINVEHLAQ